MVVCFGVGYNSFAAVEAAGMWNVFCAFHISTGCLPSSFGVSGNGPDFGQPVHLQIAFCSPLGSCHKAGFLSGCLRPEHRWPSSIAATPFTLPDGTAAQTFL